MQLSRISERACPPGIIAVAINGRNNEPHCGVVYTSAAGAVQLCDMQFEYQLGVGPPPQHYFWVEVRLDPEEILQVTVFVELIIEQHNQRPLPYSFLYTPDGFDVAGRIRDGVGVTCATFVINIFDRLQLHLVDLTTWKPRPKQDAAFRQRIINYAIAIGRVQLARRLLAEHASFRLKPWEVYGSATHSRYPVRFYQAAKLAKTVSKLVHKAQATGVQMF
jgi:hypothetical protein